MNILLYVDLGARAGWALGPTVDFIRGARGTVTLITSSDNLRTDPQILDRAARAFDGVEGVTVEKKVRDGAARDVIVAESAESRPALTIFPPSGRGLFGRMLHGSRVRTILEKAPSTVLVARKPVSEHIHRMLVTVRGGPFTETLILCAVELAETVRAEITVLHVRSDVSIAFSDAAGFAESAVAVPAESGVSAPSGKAGASELARIQEIVSRIGLATEVRSREGLVVHEILSEAREGHYDLLVVGQHLAEEESGGPLAENLAQVLALECPIPVLMVRPRLWARGREASRGASSGSLPSGGR